MESMGNEECAQKQGFEAETDEAAIDAARAMWAAARRPAGSVIRYSSDAYPCHPELVRLVAGLEALEAVNYFELDAPGKDRKA